MDKKLDELQETIATLELSEILQGAFAFLEDNFSVEKIFWFSELTLDNYTNKVWDLRPSALWLGMVDKKPWISDVEIDSEELKKLVAEWALALPQGWSQSPAKIQFKSDEKDSILVPVTDRKGANIIGRFVLIGVPFLGTPASIDLFNQAVKLIARQVKMAAIYSETKELSYTDDLTSLYNQRFLPMVLDREIKRAQRNNTSFSVLFLDIDYFKWVNDTRGHMVGSQLIIEIGNLITNSIRSTDYGFRYGGDEFVMVLLDADSQNAQKVAERIRKKVEETDFDVQDKVVSLTVSIGLATFPEHAQTREQLLKMADQAMYYGKNKSRNIVYVAS